MHVIVMKISKPECKIETQSISIFNTGIDFVDPHLDCAETGWYQDFLF